VTQLRVAGYPCSETFNLVQKFGEFVSRSLPGFVLFFAVAAAGLSCYEDSFLQPHFTQALTRVFLTGTPFPYGTVGTVEVYVVDISASTEADPAAGPDSWVRLATPMRRFDLQDMPQSRSILIDAVALPADQYHTVRVTIDQDSSTVRFIDGTEANVKWPDEGFLAVFASVEEPISVPDSGTSVVINFDAELSFFSGLGDPLHDFLFDPVVGAVNGVNTGSITGIILGDSDGDGVAEPIRNVRTTVFRGDRGLDPGTWARVATGFSDSTGYYKIGFLRPDTYILLIETQDQEFSGSLIAHDVEILAGEDFIFSVTLPVSSAAWIPFGR
jgi:hypothetical protein